MRSELSDRAIDCFVHGVAHLIAELGPGNGLAEASELIKFLAGGAEETVFTSHNIHSSTQCPSRALSRSYSTVPQRPAIATGISLWVERTHQWQVHESPSVQVTDDERFASAQIPSTDHGPAWARKFLGENRPSWLDDDLMADARLILTEMVNNAIKHGGVGTSIELVVRSHDEVFWVGVAQPTNFDGSKDGDGFGLTLVDVLSSRWGTLDWSDGTLVWFEIEKQRSGP